MDFKKPAIHKIFSLVNTDTPDFASLLSGKISLGQYHAQPYMKTGIDLMANFSGHKDYVHWIHSPTARTVLEKIRNEMGYDYVLIDTPPLSVAADVTTFMQFVDKSIVVLRTDYVYAADINDAILSLKEKTNTFVGCVLNAVHKEFSLMGQFGFDETGYYGKSGSYYNRYDKYASHTHTTENANDD
jgi:Mrp family chromosome partitioning ATPase